MGWAPSFSLLGIITHCSSCFIRFFKVSFEVATDPNRRFVPFKVTPSNGRVLLVYVPSGHKTREQLAKRHFFEGLQNHVENKSEKNKNKIILGDFNCTMDKIDRYGANKTQKIYRCGSNYAPPKLIKDNGLKDLW